MAAVNAQLANNDRRTLIVGLGKTGLSVARYLRRHGIDFAVIDSRAHPPELDALREEVPDAAVFVGDFDSRVFSAADEIILSPGVSIREPMVAAAVRRGVPVYGDIELFARSVRKPVVGITGSNGKSTVTTLIGEMLAAAKYRVAVGGNLGTPALDLLSAPEPDYYVLELSSFQLEMVESLNCVAAVCLNVSPDHLDRYDSMREYIAAKLRIYFGNGIVIINRDDPDLAALTWSQRDVRCFSYDAPSGKNFGLRARGGESFLCRGDEFLMPVSEVKIVGRHNTANALAALCLVDALGISLSPALQVLREFPGLPHRTQFVAEKDNVRWYNDSKGTNVGATIAALQGMPTKVVLLAGGLGKGQDFTLLRPAVEEKARAVIVFGADAKQIEHALRDVVPVMPVKDMREAVATAAGCAQRGDSVLLSPACASFDMFKGYDHRGQVFVDEVRRQLA